MDQSQKGCSPVGCEASDPQRKREPILEGSSSRLQVLIDGIASHVAVAFRSESDYPWILADVVANGGLRWTALADQNDEPLGLRCGLTIEEQTTVALELELCVQALLAGEARAEFHAVRVRPIPGTRLTSQVQGAAGFTCASFVEAAFVAGGCPLLDEQSLIDVPQATQDRWVLAIKTLINSFQGGGDQESAFVEDVSTSDWIRVSPMLVAATSTLHLGPHTYTCAVATATQLCESGVFETNVVDG